MFKYVFLISLLALAHAGLLSQPITYTKHEEDYNHHPQYKFNYNVHDLKTGDIKDQEESRDGDHVQGSYSLVEPDGSKRIVEYSADEHSGFNAIVRKEVGHHQEIQYQTISQHQPIQHANVLHQSIRPAAVSLHQPIQPAAAISIHEPVQPAAISLQQPIQQAAISIHEPIQQAAIGLHQPIQQAAISLHQPIQQATVSYQQPLIQPAIQHQEIGHQAQHGQLYTTQGLGYYGSGHLPLGSQAYPSYESGKLDLSGQQQLISQGLGQHDCSKFALTSHGSFGLEQSHISSELHNGHQETKYVQQAPIKTAQYPPLQIKQQLPVKIVGQYAPHSGYGHSEIKIQQHLSPTYEHGHQLSQGGQSYTDIKIDHIQTAKQISNAHTSLGHSQIKYEQIQQPQLIQPLQPIEHSYGPPDFKIQQQAQLIQPIQQSYSPPDIKIQHQHQLIQPIQQSYGPPDFKIQQQAQLIQPIQQSYSPPDIKIQQQSQLIQPVQQSYGPPDFKIQQQIGQSDLSRYEQKIQQSSQQLSESYSSASSISSSGEASQGYVYDKPAIKFELPTKAYGAP